MRSMRKCIDWGWCGCVRVCVCDSVVIGHWLACMLVIRTSFFFAVEGPEYLIQRPSFVEKLLLPTTLRFKAGNFVSFTGALPCLPDR